MKKKLIFLLWLYLILYCILKNYDDIFRILNVTVLYGIFYSTFAGPIFLVPLAKIKEPGNYRKYLFYEVIIYFTVIFFLISVMPIVLIVMSIPALFIGKAIVSSLSKPKVAGTASNNTPVENAPTTTTKDNVVLRCAKCNSVYKVTDNFCTNCGAPFSGDNVVVSVEESVQQEDTTPKEEPVNPSFYDPILGFDEEIMLEKFIEKQLSENGLSNNIKMLPHAVLVRKMIMTILFLILLFTYISLIFFHLPIILYVIGLVILIIFFCLSNRYNAMKYLKKQIKARPKEKILNIIMNVHNSSVKDSSKIILVLGVIVSFVAPLIIFYNPRIIYEQYEDGYAVRYYIFGLSNFKTAEIPGEHNGKPVLSLRGNAFSNMPKLEEVTLPDSLLEIRGQAFKNDINLKKVNIPKNLRVLGGGSFYNCKSIKEIELPNTLIEMGGEVFYNAKKLEKIKLSENLIEIRGNSFEECDSLKRITIPDTVERIGGHAFYGASSLEEVKISESSALVEIGSSAFRLCGSLKEIRLPEKTVVNSRAFKESPTVVKRYNEVYEDEIDFSDYSNVYTHAFRISEEWLIESYVSNNANYKKTLTLVSVFNHESFTFRYRDTGAHIDKTFTLSSDQRQLLTENCWMYFVLDMQNQMVVSYYVK